MHMIKVFECTFNATKFRLYIYAKIEESLPCVFIQHTWGGNAGIMFHAGLVMFVSMLFFRFFVVCFIAVHYVCIRVYMFFNDRKHLYACCVDAFFQWTRICILYVYNILQCIYRASATLTLNYIYIAVFPHQWLMVGWMIRWWTRRMW